MWTLIAKINGQTVEVTSASKPAIEDALDALDAGYFDCEIVSEPGWQEQEA